MARKSRSKKAMAAAEAEAAAPIVEEAVPSDPEAEVLDPSTHCAVDVFSNGGYQIRELPEGARKGERTLVFDGKTYEHVAEHRGLWAYRHLG